MKVLVFVLIIETFTNVTPSRQESTKEAFGQWRDVHKCVHFAYSLTTQHRFNYDIPIIAYCVPRYADPDEEIY